MKDLIGFVGFQGSGKNTAALVLEQLGYQPISFADSLKDCLSAIFGWPRHMLSGDTPESRAWREQVDEWWAARLGIPNFTPRMAMQRVGTDAIRHHFHGDIWIASVEKKISNGGKFVLTDLRYPNEINFVKRLGGDVLRIKKGPEPEWYNFAYQMNTRLIVRHLNQKVDRTMETMYPEVHETEYAWIGTPFDATIENDGSVEELHAAVLIALDRTDADFSPS